VEVNGVEIVETLDDLVQRRDVIRHHVAIRRIETQNYEAEDRRRCSYRALSIT
jgi:hypothetical protein